MDATKSATAPALPSTAEPAEAPPGAAPPERDPRPGDVVLARVPRRSEAGGTTVLPCLVLDSEVRTALDGAAALVRVTVARSRSDRLDRPGGADLVVATPEGTAAAGLRQPRRFDLADQEPIDWATERYTGADGRAVILGALSAADLDRARHIYGRAANSRSYAMPGMPGMEPRPPKPGDVVYAFAPYVDSLHTGRDGRVWGRPSPTPHPCIVVAVDRAPRADGRPGHVLVVAPGTSRKLWQTRPGNLILDDPAAAAAAGISGPGKFKFGDLAVIGFDHTWMCYRDGGPILGSLRDEELGRARDALLAALDGGLIEPTIAARFRPAGAARSPARPPGARDER